MQRDAAVRRVDFGRVCVYFGEKNGKFPEANQVLLRGTEVRAAFDAPLVANRIGRDFDATELVIMSHTHEDHMAGLHRLPDAAVHVHEADLRAMQSWEGFADAYVIADADRAGMLDWFRRDFHYAPRPDAVGFGNDASWDLGGLKVEAIHMPGHTAGHTALLVDAEGVLFVGDIDLSSFGPYYGDASSSLADFRRTLEMLPGIPARTWITAHHRGVYTERSAFLDDVAAYVAKLDAREQRLLELLRIAPRTLPQLVECRLLYPQNMKARWVDGIEERTIARHLDELMVAGRVSVDAEGRYRRV